MRLLNTLSRYKLRLAFGFSILLLLAYIGNVKISSSSEPDLANFLTSSKEKYLRDLRESPGKGKEWTVVVGNEAGDLDSLASSIAFAWLRTNVQDTPTIPLVRMERDDLELRAENIYALSLAGISKPKEQLLFLTDLADIKPFPSYRMALVDHNRLDSSLSSDDPPSVVSAIIDHHADENLHGDTADPRIVAPAGSCSSHIASLFQSKIPAELATLLLSAILIDTDGLKPGGKALDVDRQAAEFLAIQSTLADSLPSVMLAQANVSDAVPESVISASAMKDLTRQLSEKKFEVSHLGPRDLLRRDYKEYTYTAPWSPSKPTLRAGLSTVPVELKRWAADGNLEKEGYSYMKERNLNILGILTSYHTHTGKHKREMAWILRNDSLPADDFDVDELATRLWSGLEANEQLEVKENKDFSPDVKVSESLHLRTKAYKQNPHATRKVTAPVLRSIIERED